MKSKERGYNNLEIKFWKDWLEADYLERFELVEKLPAFEGFLPKKDNKMERRAFALLLNSFFEDLESAVYTKIRLEKKIKKEGKII